ncbi:unnamed protein product, partial [Porites evermanni]
MYADDTHLTFASNNMKDIEFYLNQDLANLQKLQNRAARVLTFSGYDASADPLIEILGWQKLESQRSFHKAVMVYKSLNGLAPEYMRS